MKSGQAIYRALLVLAPRRLRRAHGADMEALFAERLAAARAIGRTAMATAWIHAAGDLLRARVRGWRAERVPLTVYIDERTTIMIGSDLRYAWRALLRQRGASALVVLMLALGIAANVAVFTLVNGLFLRPFPFPRPDRLASSTPPRRNGTSMSSASIFPTSTGGTRIRSSSRR